MELGFYKLGLCRSDVILVDDIGGGNVDRDWPRAAARMLDRRSGAGADRLAVLTRFPPSLPRETPRESREVWLRVFDAEGEKGPYADAALCAARFLLDSGRSPAEEVRLRLPADAEAGEGISVDVLDSASLGIALGPPRRYSPSGEGDGEALRSQAEAAAEASTVEAGGERLLVLPLRLGLPPAGGVAVFAEGGSSDAKARVRSKEGGETAIVVRVLSRNLLRISGRAVRGHDRCSSAALALVAAASVGYADRDATARLGSCALWLEWTEGGQVYAAGRPEYLYRGEFHLDE